MANINQNLSALLSVKQDIKTAIEEKGQDLTNVPFSGYAEQIRNIETGNSGITEIDVESEGISFGWSAFEYLPEHYKLDNCQYMTGMFYNCLKLKSLDVSMINWNNVKDTQYTFYGLDSLEDINLPNPFILGATYVNRMFQVNYSTYLKFNFPTFIYLPNVKYVNEFLNMPLSDNYQLQISAPILEELHTLISFQKTGIPGNLVIHTPLLKTAINPFWVGSYYYNVQWEMGDRTVVSNWNDWFVNLNIGWGRNDETDEPVEWQQWEVLSRITRNLYFNGNYKNFRGYIGSTAEPSDLLTVFTGLNNYVGSLYLGRCSILPSNQIKNIINNLGQSDGNSEIVLSPFTLSGLTEDDIALATSKGFRILEQGA